MLTAAAVKLVGTPIGELNKKQKEKKEALENFFKNKIINENCLTGMKQIPDGVIDCCVTSPPYWGLRDYGHDEQIGMEETPDKFVETLVEVFAEVKRILKPEGTLWLNLGDTYSAHKDCKSVSDSLRKGGRSEEANVIEKGKSNSRNSKTLKSVGLKNKDLIGVPWAVAFALRSNGWWLRQDIIWHKPNPMPESVTDRCTKSHEYIFLMSKSAKYYFDSEAIQEEATGYDGRKDTFFKGSTKYLNGFAPEGTSEQTLAKKGHERWRKKSTFGNRDGELNGLHSGNEWTPKRKNEGTNHGGNGTGFQDHSGYSNLENPYIRNKRSVWTVNTKPYADAHFATFPEKLIEDCIKAGCPKDGIVLDPFMGAGTTAVVARKLGRNFTGFELNPKYLKIAENRLHKEIGLFL